MATIASMSNPDDDGLEQCWPTAAASRVRVQVQDGSISFCRLFHNRSTGAIELVPCNDGDDDMQQPEVYDDSNAGIEEEPTYQSYIATSNDGNRAVTDSFHPDDVIGANLSFECNLNNPNTFHGMKSYASSKFNIYYYPKSGKHNMRKANHKHYTLDPRCCEDFADARNIIQAIKKLSKISNIQSPLNCLVILNPFSGGGGEASRKGAKHVYKTLVKPLLEEAGVEHDALVTQRGGHAQQRMEQRKSTENSECNNSNEGEGSTSISTDLENKDITEYDAIIAMGGDGILFEIFQGIHARQDEKEIMSTMKFGKLACGTSNGLVKSVMHWSGADYDHMESLFHICKGHTSTLDVANYQVLSSTPKSYISFLSYAWGLIADVDFESECLRCLGALRTDVWAVYRGILFRKQYRAKFSYLPPKAAGNGEIIMPKLGEPLPNGWVKFDGEEFLVFWVCNTSHASYNVYTCPPAKMNDGLFHVLIVRSSCSKLRLLQMLLKLETGGHFDFKELEYITCVAYQFEPLTETSYNILDGEHLEDGPIQASMMPSGARFFAGAEIE